MEKKFDVNRDLGVESVDWDKVDTDTKRQPPRYPSELNPQPIDKEEPMPPGITWQDIANETGLPPAVAGLGVGTFCPPVPDPLDAPLQAPEEKGAKYNPRTQKFELPNE